MDKIVLAAFALIFTSASAPAQNFSSEELNRRTIERRAFEAVVWGMPAVNTELMYDQMLKAGGKANQMIYWGRPLDWRNQTLTPNPDTLYFMGFYDTRIAGPMVIEVHRRVMTAPSMATSSHRGRLRLKMLDCSVSTRDRVSSS